MIKYMRGIVICLTLYCIIPTVYAGITERVSVSTAGVQADINYTSDASISADGRYVAFYSRASNLVVGDTNGFTDIFVHDRVTGTTELVSVSSSGEQGNLDSRGSSISADGRFVVFLSKANNLVADDTNNNSDFFVHDRVTRTTERVSISSAGEQVDGLSYGATISADGRYVAFDSGASNLVVDDTNGYIDVFVHNRATGTTKRVSVSSAGAQGNDLSYLPSISADGRFVVFYSRASNLVEGDTNNSADIFVYDLTTGTTKRVSVSSAGVQGNKNSSFRTSISADGRFVAFESDASNLVANDTNGSHDIFVHDRNTEITERVNVSSEGVQANVYSFSPSISADGRFVAFESYASNLVAGDTNGNSDVFVHDRDTEITERVSTSSAGEQGNDESHDPSISADGRLIAFESDSKNLITNDTNGVRDIFVGENNLLNLTGDLTVNLTTASGAVQVGEYIHFRARLKNIGDTDLTNCTAQIVNPYMRYPYNQRLFSYFSWPIKVANPVKNGSIDIAPGETGQFYLAVLPRVAMRREVSFNYICDNTEALTIPFINTVHLIAKNEPLIAEDFVQLKNSNNRTELVIDRSNGKYWTGHVVKVSNNGSEATSVNLIATSHFSDAALRQPRLCEPLDPVNNNWTCINPRDTQLQVDLEPGVTKKIRVFVHARKSIDKQPIANRIYLEARDGAGEVVSKTSVGISTIN